jgi:hypothetical protein
MDAVSGARGRRWADGTSMAASGAPGLALLIAGFFVSRMPTEREERR